jgi:hypothetical protein
MSGRDPTDFSFLTTDERVFIARQRIGSLIEHVWSILIVAAHLKSMDEAPIFKEVVGGRAEISPKIIKELIVNIFTVELCGVWEAFDAAGYNIMTLLAVVDSPAVIARLQREAESAAPVGFGFDVSLSSDDLKRIYDELKLLPKLTDTFIKNNESLLRIRNYRNKFAAHPIYMTRDERRRGEIAIPSDDDVLYLIDKAKGNANKLCASITGRMKDFAAIQSITQHDTDFFYKGLAFIDHTAMYPNGVGAPRHWGFVGWSARAPVPGRVALTAADTAQVEGQITVSDPDRQRASASTLLDSAEVRAIRPDKGDLDGQSS